MIVILQCLNVKRAKCREFMRGFIISILLLGFTTGTLAQNLADNAIEVEAKGSYLMGVGTSKQLARQLAIFEAKRSALETAGKYLTHKSLIPFYEMKKEEIYSLTARETQGEIIEERWEPIGKTMKCLIRIRAKVQISDFIKAGIQNQSLQTPLNCNRSKVRDLPAMSVPRRAKSKPAKSKRASGGLMTLPMDCPDYHPVCYRIGKGICG